jgi:hypothetical protein
LWVTKTALIRPSRVVLQPARELLDGRAGAPGHVDHLDVELEMPRHVDPELGELALAAHQHLVARRQRVGHRRFPGAGARAGVDQDAAPLGAEDPAQILEEAEGEVAEVGARMSCIGTFIA